MTARKPLYLEITPPASPLPHVLLRRAAAVGHRIAGVHVIQRPDRLASLEACRLLGDAAIEATWHLVTRGRSLAEIEREVRRAAQYAIARVLCLRGDHAAEDHPTTPTPTLRSTVQMLRRALPGASIGVSFNPAAPGDRALKSLMGKLAAGADFVQTHPVFTAGAIDAYADEIHACAPHVKVIPSVMPLATAEVAERAAERMHIPPPVHAVGWTAFTELLAGALCDPRYAGVAIMTTRMDLDPPTTAALALAVDDARAAERASRSLPPAQP
jgi:5,10-methylenetetrahydrofolate reductase